MKRRNFIKKAGATSLAAIVGGTSALSASSRWKRVSPLEKLNVGLIGCNGMGWRNTASLMKMKDLNLLAICDVDASALQRRMRDYQMLNKGSVKPKAFADYTRVLSNKNVDIVVIGSPDHWHCMQTCHALEAGKHVYVEKPVANTIEECNLMVKSQERYIRMVQVGQWQRSAPHYRKAVELVQSGILGSISQVKVWAFQNSIPKLPVKADGQAPRGVDYARWLGPAKRRAFNENRFHFNFRWFWDYSGGLITDWGVHQMDIVLQAMGVTMPQSVSASGVKYAYPHSAAETPDAMEATFEYGDFTMSYEHASGIGLGHYQKSEGIAFIGSNGTLVVNRDGYEIISENKPEILEQYDIKSDKDVPNVLDLHTKNFIASVKIQNETILNAHLKTGSLAAITAQMANISFKTGSTLNWDAIAGNLNQVRLEFSAW